MKIQTWNEDRAKSELKKRYDFARNAKSKLEKIWEQNETTVYSTYGGNNTTSASSSLLNTDLNLGSTDVDDSSANIAVVYAFKNLRFIHAQMSANPPSVVARPASNDPEDRRKADAADRLVRHAVRKYKMQEKVDAVSLNTLLYGSGFMKTVWNSEKGELLEFDAETGEMELEGELDITVPNPWNIFIDPDADCWDDVRYVIERKLVPYEEACFRWPDKKEILEAARIQQSETADGGDFGWSKGSSSQIATPKYDVVEVFEYWEKGTAPNAYLGRFCVFISDGTPLMPVKPNPHRFKPEGNSKAKYAIANLPYHLLTDIDWPDHIWGKSFMEYVAPLQDTLNRLDTVYLDNIRAHGVSRLVLPEGAEIADDSITNSPWDIIRITGSQPPHFVNTPQSVPMVNEFRELMRIGIDDLSGVNESMFGQQKREQSGFAMQYATDQGNMIRRRLFNKYAMFVESVYKSYLSIIREHWSTPKTVKVIGKEKALEAIDIKGADIDGGFDLVVEYGNSLSLDPMTRRQELTALQPLFEKAGVPVRVSLKMMKLNELEGMYDMMQLAEDRQREIFEEMISTEAYIQPEKFQDHENMLAYAMQFVMTTEYKYLEEDHKALILQHIEDRAALAAQEKAPAPMGGPGVPGPAPAMGELPQETAPLETQPPGPIPQA